MGAVYTITGFVIGVSVFILPGKLAGMAGPGLMVAYVIAGVLALFSCLVAAQLGVLVPAEGGTFVVIARLLSPFAGFLVVWQLVASTILATALLAYGFADYFVLLVPEAGRMAVAMAVVALFGGLNLAGARAVIRVQGALVIWFLLALGLFVGIGLFHIEAQNLTPLAPRGAGSVLKAATIAYFSFAGFAILMEIGGEIRRPARNIPLALAISLGLVMVAYLGVSLVLVGMVSWRDLGAMAAPVAGVAALMMPGWMLTGLSLAVLAAAATTINGLILAYPRDLLAMARVGAFPAALARLSPRHGGPTGAIVLFTGLCLVVIGFGATIEDYAVMAVFGLMFQQIMFAWSLVRAPRLLAARFAGAQFRLPPPLLYGAALALAVISLAFVAISVVESPKIALGAGVILALGALYYGLRQRQMARRGVDIARNIAVEVAQISAEP